MGQKAGGGGGAAAAATSHFTVVCFACPLRSPLLYLLRAALRVQLATLFSWYAALLILWVRRPWYDTAWGENDSLNEGDEEEV